MGKMYSSSSPTLPCILCSTTPINIKTSLQTRCFMAVVYQTGQALGLLTGYLAAVLALYAIFTLLLGSTWDMGHYFFIVFEFFVAGYIIRRVL